MNGYQLTDAWFEFRFQHPEKVSHAHTELYFYLVYHWNKLSQKEKFGLPSAVTMEATGIRNYKTYRKCVKDLAEFGFIRLVSEAINQHQAMVVAWGKNTKADTEALTEALTKAQSEALTHIGELSNYITKELKKEGGEKKVKEKKKFIAPSVDEVRAYFEEKAYPLDLVQQIYSHYADADWTKANGGKVIDWKRTISNNWQEKFDRHKARQQHFYQNVNQNYYPPKPEHDPILLRQEVHSNYGDYVRHCLKVGHQPEKPKYPELVPADFDHIAFINQIKSTL
jgi:hypothetical protein